MSRLFVITLTIIIAVLIFGATILFDVFSFDFAIKNGLNNNKKYPITISSGDVTIRVEVANTLAKRATGLSGKESLSLNDGLLFVFKESGKHTFWMKDMNFPIDIIWINEHFFVVDVTENITPATFPEIYEPIEKIKYVLEVNAGWAKQNDVQRGIEIAGIRDIR